MAKAIMIQGTMPGVGKSLVAAGLCRVLKEDGMRVAPFKAKSIEEHSYVTREGLEMGRSQVIQSEAAGIAPTVLMNPVLLKPVSETEYQLIVNGEIAGIVTPENAASMETELAPYIREAYELLSEQYDVIVIEGTEGAAELGIKKNSFANMGMAKFAKAPVILVGDAKKGGIFAQLYGTAELLEEQDKKRLQGLVVNKIGIQETILEQGFRTLEHKTHKKIIGMIPYLDMKMEEEDGIFRHLDECKKEPKLDIAVIRFPQIANYTDFSALERLSSIRVRYISTPEEMEYPDMIILPGTKHTISDLLWLREINMEEKIVNQYKQGALIFGIGGGYQMLGVSIQDTTLLANMANTVAGIGLLPVESIWDPAGGQIPFKGKLEMVMGPYEKLSKAEYKGYEIEIGHSKALEPLRPLAQSEGKLLGVCKGRVAGTYLHGFFDSREVASGILNILADQKGIRIEEDQEDSLIDHKEEQYRTLALQLRESLEMKKIYEMIEKGEAYEGRG